MRTVLQSVEMSGLILFIIGILLKGVSAELEIVISSGPLVDSGTDTTLTCTSTESGTIRQVSWKKGPFNVTFNDADAILLSTLNQAVIWDPLVDQNHYEFDAALLGGVPLTIKSVTLHDEAQYWCRLNIGSGIGNQFGTAVMRVRVYSVVLQRMKMSGLLLFIVGILLKSTSNQALQVSAPPVSSVNGTRTTLTCSYSMSTEGFVLYRVLWYNSDVFVASSVMARFSNTAITNPEYFIGYDSSTHTMTRDDSMSTFTFAEVNVYNDGRIYGCEVEYRKGLDRESGRATTKLTVIVFPSIITLSDSTGAYPPGWTSNLVEGDNREYTCVVPDINPGASFTWTVGDEELVHSYSNTVDDNGLTTSTSTASLVASFEQHHNRELKCLAINKEGTDGTSISVTIDVKVPPKESSVSLSYGGNDLVPGGNLTVNQGEEQTLTCTVEGSRPAATITLLRDGMLQETEDQTPEGDGLVNTMEDWVFTPQRNYHKQRVECEAKTNESTTPYPAAYLILAVDGPPDIPVISGSLTMTADMVTTLTCTADLGYPDDWDLVWSNSGSDIRDQPNTMAALSGTSQRYMFTSELEFTPKRRDNTHFINCTASRASWTSTPLPEYKWGPINVQYEGSITNKHLTEVGIGGGLTANLTCIAKGNPAPIITWVDPNGVDIITGGNSNKHTVVVSYTTSDTDMTIGNVTTSTLSIWAVDPQVDYGVYTCNSNNGIGQPDKHEIIVNGTRVPDQPTGVVLTDRTSSSIAVRWSAGYDGGETQWFNVSHKKTAEDSSETFSDRIDGEVTTYNVDGLESFTEYEIKVYAQNDVGRNPRPGSIVEYTLPGVPTSDSGFTLLFDSNEGTVKIDGLNANKGECIQLEVKREGIPGWTSCGDCIETNGTFTLLYWCLQTRKRRGRAIGDVEMVRAKLCQMISQLCGDFINVMEPEIAPPVTDPPASSTTGTAVGVTVGIVSLAVIVFALVFYFRRKYRNRNGSAEEINLTTQTKHQGLEQKRNALQGTADYQEVADIVEPTDRTYANVLFKDKSFPRDMLKIIKELGHGAFGEVFLAEANGILKKSKVTLVAVKTLKEGASQSDKDDLLRELDLMKKLPDHKNVVRLMGFSVEQDPLYIIVEYLSKGNLKDLLKDSRVKGTTVYGNLHGASKSLSCGDLMKFANDVADGMHYISSQKCIHRDLAARNVLVAEDMTCKVSDFGLARDVIDNRVYERKSEGRLPLRWMALESILDEMYTTKSDVWSFGVLLWEIVTLGARPYPTMSAKLMLKQLRIGFRMPQPTHCQGELYEMMLKCWEEEPDRRPTFEVIADELRQLRELDKDYIVVNAYEETIYAVTIPDGEQEKC
ncbi:uncharacterized protein [Asterias amurensis]|uniref:uncharacterized protein isoform X4 n=1 Tax=Asterias amurensis TaxID=7602 RepID=UPI003AB6BCEA